MGSGSPRPVRATAPNGDPCPTADEPAGDLGRQPQEVDRCEPRSRCGGARAGSPGLQIRNNRVRCNHTCA